VPSAVLSGNSITNATGFFFPAGGGGISAATAQAIALQAATTNTINNAHQFTNNASTNYFGITSATPATLGLADVIGGWDFITASGYTLLWNGDAVVTNNQKAVTLTGTFTGNGANLTNLNAVTVFNVKAYGAKGDGSTDDTLAISNTVAAMTNNGGGTLYIPHGTYAITNTIVIDGRGKLGFQMKGEGCGADDGWSGGATNTQPANTMIVINSSTKPILVITNCFTGFVHEIAFQNTNSAPASGAENVVVGSTNDTPTVSFWRCSFHGGYTQLHYYEGSLWTVDTCYFINTYYRSLWVENDAIGDTGDWSLINCVFIERNHPADSALCVTSSGGARIIGNKFNSSSGGSIGFTNNCYICPNQTTSGLTFTGNNVENALVQGFVTYTTNGSSWNSMSICGNHFENMTYGVALISGVGNNSTVSDNVFEGTFSSAEIGLVGMTGIFVGNNMRSNGHTPVPPLLIGGANHEIATNVWLWAAP
jgi:hypothetical protein